MLITQLLLAKYLTGVVLGFAVFIIVFNGYLYVSADGDPHQSEKAKMNIVSAGIGMCICATSSAVISLFTKLSNIDLQHTHSPFSLGKTVFIVSILFLSFFILYLWTDRNISSDEQEETNESLPENERADAPNTSFHSFEEIETFYTHHEPKNETATLFLNLIAFHRDILQNRHLLSLEEQYRIEESFVTDVMDLFHSYQNSETSIQESYQFTVHGVLEQLQEELRTIQQHLHHHQTHELEKSLLRISNRYK